MLFQLLLSFYLTTAVANANSSENSSVILECPFGWVAKGQAWYTQKIEGDQWDSSQPAHVGQTSYITSILLGERADYNPKKYVICLICEYDSSKANLEYQRWIEVCGTQTNFIRTEKTHFEIQICSFSYDYKTFITYENTMNWCQHQTVCAIKVFLKMNNLYDALQLTSPVLCSGTFDINSFFFAFLLSIFCTKVFQIKHKWSFWKAQSSTYRVCQEFGLTKKVAYF